jgi:hypothetical protein
MSVFRHTVLLRFREGTSNEQIEAVLAGLGTMPEKIDWIRRYEFGRDAGVMEGNPQVALVADFDSEVDWRAYLDHPDHRAFVKGVVGPILEEMTRVQYRVE